MTLVTEPSLAVPAESKAMIWTGHVLSALPALFLLMDAAMKLFPREFVVKATTDAGFSERVIVPLGIVLLVSTLLYLIPPTAVLGAILLTGYLGGAVATNVRAKPGWFTILFPVLFGVLLWLGLWLREPRLRALVFWRR